MNNIQICPGKGLAMTREDPRDRVMWNSKDVEGPSPIGQVSISSLAWSAQDKIILEPKGAKKLAGSPAGSE